MSTHLHHFNDSATRGLLFACTVQFKQKSAMRSAVVIAAMVLAACSPKSEESLHGITIEKHCFELPEHLGVLTVISVSGVENPTHFALRLSCDRVSGECGESRLHLWSVHRNRTLDILSYDATHRFRLISTDSGVYTVSDGLHTTYIVDLPGNEVRYAFRGPGTEERGRGTCGVEIGEPRDH